MAQVKYRLPGEFSAELGFNDHQFEFMVDQVVKAPNGVSRNIKNSPFPRNEDERNMLLQAIFQQGQKMQLNTGNFPEPAMEYLSKYAAEGQSGQMKGEVAKVIETAERRQEDPIGFQSSLMKFEGQTTPYKTDTINVGGVIPIPWIAGDEEGGLPATLDNIVADAITFAKRRMPRDPGESGRIATVVAADLGLMAALKKANLANTPWGPQYSNFLMPKVMEGLNKASQGGVLTTGATVGATSGIASATYDIAYNWANRAYRNSFPTAFEMNEDGTFKLDKKGNKIPKQPSITEDMLSTMDSAMWEAAFSGGAAAGVLGAQKLWKNFVSKGTGVDPTSMTQKELQQMAAQYNIPMSIIAATPSDSVKGYARVVGVFPFVGGPIRKSQDAAKQAINTQLQKTFVELAPYQKTLDTIQALGDDSYKAFKQNFENFSGMKASLYEAYDDIAKEISEPFIPTKRVTGYLNSIVPAQKSDIPLSSVDVGSRYVYNVREALGLVTGDPNAQQNMVQALTALGSMPEYLTASQFRDVQQAVNEAIKKLNPSTGGVSAGSSPAVSKILGMISKNLRTDLDDLTNWKKMSGRNQVLAEVAKQRLTDANTFFYSNKDDFASFFAGQGATRVGQAIETTVDSRFMQPGAPKAPGIVQTDQLFDIIMDTKTIQTSMKAQNELYRQVGPDMFNRLSNGWLDKQVSKYITVYDTNVMPIKTKDGIVMQQRGSLKDFGDVRGLSAGVPVIDVSGLRKTLGLDKVGADAIGGMEARSTSLAMTNMFNLMGKGGVEAYKKIDDLLTLAERVQSFDVADVSKFVQRRGVLAGPKALTTAATVGVGFANPLGALGMILLTRGISKFLASPKAYANIMKGLDDNLSPALRRDALIEVAKFVDDEILFDKEKGAIEPSPINVAGSGSTLITREAPEKEKSRKKAQKTVLGIEDFYDKKIEALSIPEILNYFVSKAKEAPGSEYSKYMKFKTDPRSGELVPVKAPGGVGANKFDEQQFLLANMDPAEKLAKDIFGEEQGQRVANYAEAQAANAALSGVQGTTGDSTYYQPIKPGPFSAGLQKMYPEGIPRKAGSPNPFLTNLGKFYQTNIAPVMNSPLVGFPNPLNLFNRPKVDQNKLNQQQRIAMSTGNLNQAIASRMNQGGIASTRKK